MVMTPDGERAISAKPNAEGWSWGKVGLRLLGMIGLLIAFLGIGNALGMPIASAGDEVVRLLRMLTGAIGLLILTVAAAAEFIARR